MIQKYKLFALVALMGASIEPQAAEIITDAKKIEELKNYTKVLQQPTITIQGAMDMDSVYLLKLEERAVSSNESRMLTAFLDKKTHALYIGAGVDSEGALLQYPKEKNIISEGISFSSGNGKKEIYIVTDPQCSYCKKLELAIGDKLSNYRVHTILMPLSFHKEAPLMAEWIMQGKDDKEKYERYRKIAIDNSKEYQKLGNENTFTYSQDTQEKINKSLKAAKELNAQGTPMIYDSNFNQIAPQQLIVDQK